MFSTGLSTELDLITMSSVKLHLMSTFSIIFPQVFLYFLIKVDKFQQQFLILYAARSVAGFAVKVYRTEFKFYFT